MKKKITLSYSDLNKKQLQYLKELYIQKKIDSMSKEELKEFVLEIITQQINDTIGKEEEQEAWREILTFFGDEFEIIVKEIQQKFQTNDNYLNVGEDHQKERLELLERINTDKEKKDMWDD